MPADVRDQLGRPLRDLRVSVTDRCNFRCPYCMPAEVFGADYPFLKASQTMAFDELTRILRAFASLGVEKLRLTGGEPLLRNDLAEVVRFAKQQGIADVALTTNGWLLERSVAALRAAGLDRLNVSLDSLDPTTFARMNGRNFEVARVLRGIEAAVAAGLPTKINTVLQRGVNDGEVETLAAWARERGLTLRFIEFMDVGNHNDWEQTRVVPAREILAKLEVRWPLESVSPSYRGEVARRYRYRDGRAEVGFITSISEPFCGDCNRARLSADGKLFTCLFATQGADLLSHVRAAASPEMLVDFIAGVWGRRADRYSEQRAELLRAGEVVRAKAEMSYLGG